MGFTKDPSKAFKAPSQTLVYIRLFAKQPDFEEAKSRLTTC